MRIAVFGAAGRTGREVVRQALDRGYEVTAFVRSRDELMTTADRLRVIEGDARDPSAVHAAVDRSDAAISVLALMAPDREPEYSEATRTIVEAAEQAGVRRFVLTANNDVLTDRDVTGEYAPHAREHRRNRGALEASGLEWTIGAAPWVTDDSPTGAYVAMVDSRAPGTRLSAADFATFTLDALERQDWVRHVVGVSGGAPDETQP